MSNIIIKLADNKTKIYTKLIGAAPGEITRAEYEAFRDEFDDLDQAFRTHLAEYEAFRDNLEQAFKTLSQELVKRLVELDHAFKMHLIDFNTHMIDFNAHKAVSAQKHIAESGSNDDGYYIKFDDGTMICWTIGPVQLTFTDATILSYNWNLPQQYLNDTFTCIPNIGLVSRPEARGGSVPYTSGYTTTSVSLRVYNNVIDFVSGDTATARPITIGRWK